MDRLLEWWPHITSQCLGKLLVGTPCQPTNGGVGDCEGASAPNCQGWASQGLLATPWVLSISEPGSAITTITTVRSYEIPTNTSTCLEFKFKCVFWWTSFHNFLDGLNAKSINWDRCRYIWALHPPKGEKLQCSNVLITSFHGWNPCSSSWWPNQQHPFDPRSVAQ